MISGYRGGRTRPRLELNQRDRNRNRPRRPQPGQGYGQASAGVGGMPKYPPTPPSFLPMTPGYEAVSRGANDMLMQAENAYGTGMTLTPAQIALQQQRLTTDQSLATDRLKENLAERGIYTARNAAGAYGATSPAGGGVGESLYSRNIATPFGREFQDLATRGAGAYGDMTSGYANAMTGYNQAMLEGLLSRAGDAFQAEPLGLPIGGYQVPDMANPSFSNRPRRGRTRRRNRNRGK